jgi:predicted nucleotidyltransferase
MNESAESQMIQTVLAHFPYVQAVYLFGSYGTEDEWPTSDVDIALLLPPEEAKQVGSLVLSDLPLELERLLHKDVDLINVREVSTVFQIDVANHMIKVKKLGLPQDSKDSFTLLHQAGLITAEQMRGLHAMERIP